MRSHENWDEDRHFTTASLGATGQVTDVPVGERSEVFRAGLANRIAGPIVTFITLATSTALFIAAAVGTFRAEDPQHEKDWFLICLMAGGSLIPLGFGIWFALRTRTVLAFRVELYTNGVFIKDASGWYAFPWQLLTQVLETDVQEYPVGLGVLPGVSIGVPLGQSRYLTLSRTDGLTYTFGIEQIKGMGRLRKLLRAECAERGIQVDTDYQDTGPLRHPFN